TYRKSIKDRKRNYQEVLARLAGNERFLENGAMEEDPMLLVTADCTHFWRTCPSLILDETDPDKGPGDKSSDENHVYDELAYACRSRPYVTTEQDRWFEENREWIRQARKEVVDPYATKNH
ncbi:MAG: hypothetical protein ACR2P5_06790, partial [Gammaproteobacteria bacterium]